MKSTSVWVKAEIEHADLFLRNGIMRTLAKGHRGPRDLAKVVLRAFRRILREEQGTLGEQRPQPITKPASGGRFGVFPDLGFKSGAQVAVSSDKRKLVSASCG